MTIELEEQRLLVIKEREERERMTRYIEQVNQANKDLKYENVRLSEDIARLAPFEPMYLSWKEKYENLEGELRRLNERIAFLAPFEG